MPPLPFEILTGKNPLANCFSIRSANTFPPNCRTTWSGLLIYEGHVRSGKVMTCPAPPWGAYCWENAYTMTTGKAREFLGNSGINLWHMAYDRYGLNYFVQGRMSRPYPRMRIDQIRQPSQKIAIGDSRDSTSAGNPPPHRFRDRAEAMDTLSVFTGRGLLPWASSCSGQDGRKRSPIPTRRAPTNPTDGSTDPQRTGKKRESESDDSALGIISAVKEYGLRVPDDISIIGESGIPGSAFFDPPLTTISHDIPRRRCS